MHAHTFRRLPSLALLALLTACPGPQVDEGCVEFADDEVGGGCNETGGPGALEPDECIYNENPNTDGYRIQCEGKFHSKIDFDLALVGKNCEEAVGGDFCSQVYPFGPPHDGYEAPDVMACCGEAWDPVAYLDVYQDACMLDLAAQACASIAKRLEQAVEAGDFDTEDGDFTDKAEKLQAYVADHSKECTAALHDSDTDPDPGALVSHWDIPNKLGWWPAKNITISVEAGTSVVDVHRPENEIDWLACHGALDNDDEIFEDQRRPDGGIIIDTVLYTSVDADLAGPVLGGGKVTSATSFDTNCVEQGCPRASWSYDEGLDRGFSMEEFQLYATNFEATNGLAVLTVERARIELWTQAPGTKIFDARRALVGYEVPAGQAWFYIAGLANGAYGRFMATNSTTIEIARDDEIWVVHGFGLEFVDGADRTWTIALEDSRWQR